MYTANASTITIPKGFKFKLQTLLQLRTRYFEQVQTQFARQQQKLVDLQNKQADMRAHIEALLHPDAQQAQSNPFLYQQRFAYVGTLKTQVTYLGQQINQAQKELERIRYDLHQAHVQKKSLERLKEKHYLALQSQMNRQQDQDLEDIMMMRYNRT